MDIGARDACGRSLLHLAVECENVEAVAFLLDLGCPPDANDARGQTPLHVACRTGAVKVSVPRLVLSRFA